MRRVLIFVASAALLVPGLLSAQPMMGGGSFAPNAAGMLVMAGDGSILVTQMGMSMMGGPAAGSASQQRAVIDLGTDGKERWRATFAQGWPMMASTNGDLVVVVVMNSAWMWRALSGMGWFPFGAPPQGASQDASLVGLDLATGTQRWATALPGDMGSYPQFSQDGSRVYVSVTDFGAGSMMGGGSLRQGDTGGWVTQMTNKVVALTRAGAILWTADLSSSGGMMP